MSGYSSRDGPIPMRVWIVSFIAWLAILFLLHAFGVYSINFYDSIVTTKFIIVALGVFALLAGSLGSWNAGYEDVNTKNKPGKGIGFFILYLALGYIFYVFLIALAQDPTITYLSTVWTVLVLHLWLLIIEIVFGYLAIYLVW